MKETVTGVRRQRRERCEWCWSDLRVHAHGQRPRFGKRYCSGACRQAKYRVRRWYTWKDRRTGEILTGADMEARGLALTLDPWLLWESGHRRVAVLTDEEVGKALRFQRLPI